jgi:hypothetical protein
VGERLSIIGVRLNLDGRLLWINLRQKSRRCWSDAYHRINANQLHRWRWLYRNDQLGSYAERLELGSVTGFLPVKLTSSVLAPKPRAAVVVNKPVISSPALPDPVLAPSSLTVKANSHIELFVGDHRVCIHGDVQVSNLRAVLVALNSTSQALSHTIAPNAMAHHS